MNLRMVISKMGPIRAIVPVLVVIGIIIIAISYHSPSFSDSRSSVVTSTSAASNSANLLSATHQEALAKHAYNASLGFGEIVYISMPERTDRQDAMNLLGSAFGLKLKLIPGVRGSEIPPKAIPDGAPSDMRESVLGCWRAHANAWRYLLESEMDTLLIFEDDLDWNPNVKKTLETLSLQMQNSKIRLTEPSNYERERAPYGLDWDVLYVGTWRHGGNPELKEFVQIWDDPDVPEKEELVKSTKLLDALYDFGLTDDEIGKKRVLAPAYLTMSTTAYAITRKGAQRLLYTLSYIGLRGDVDQEIMRLFKEGQLRGYTLSPPAFSQFKVGGSKDSDNEERGKTLDGHGNVNGHNINIKGSAREWMVNSLKIDNWADYRQLSKGTINDRDEAMS
ncbi:hypothetical protein V1506DRAFT_548168 [Lipomyces tetrasporus]